MKNFNLRHLFVVAAASAALSGCAMNEDKPPTTADLMRGYADDQQAQVERKNDIATDWDDAQKMIAEGRKNIEEGNERVASGEQSLRDGNELIETGNRKVTEGSELARDAEQSFRSAYPGLELGTRSTDEGN